MKSAEDRGGRHVVHVCDCNTSSSGFHVLQYYSFLSFTRSHVIRFEGIRVEEIGTVSGVWKIEGSLGVEEDGKEEKGELN